MALMQDPATRCAAVTPSDTTDLGQAVRGIFVGTPGDVAIQMVGDTTATVHKAMDGYYPIRARRIFATGTTALDIVAWY